MGRTTMKIIFSLFSVLLAVTMMTGQAQATSAKDLETIARAVGFMNNGPTGAVSVDVVFDPANADSAAHADEVIGLLAGGVGSKVTLTGKKVSAAGDITSRVIFLTRGAGSLYGPALNTAAGNNGITVSTDDACLGNGCVLVVKTQPSVDILVSTAAAAKTNTEFASAFSMMITKK